MVDVEPNQLDQHFGTTYVESLLSFAQEMLSKYDSDVDPNSLNIVHQSTQLMLSENTQNVEQSSLAQHFGSTYVDRYVDRIFYKG